MQGQGGLWKAARVDLALGRHFGVLMEPCPQLKKFIESDDYFLRIVYREGNGWRWAVLKCVGLGKVPTRKEARQLIKHLAG